MKCKLFIHTLRFSVNPRQWHLATSYVTAYKNYKNSKGNHIFYGKAKDGDNFECVLAYFHMNRWMIFVVRIAYISNCIFVCLQTLVYTVNSLHSIRKWRHGVYICFGFIGNSVCVIILSFSSPFHWNEPMLKIPFRWLVTFRRQLTTDFWLWVYSVYNPKVEF